MVPICFHSIIYPNIMTVWIMANVTWITLVIQIGDLEIFIMAQLTIHISQKCSFSKYLAISVTSQERILKEIPLQRILCSVTFHTDGAGVKVIPPFRREGLSSKSFHSFSICVSWCSEGKRILCGLVLNFRSSCFS